MPAANTSNQLLQQLTAPARATTHATQTQEQADTAHIVAPRVITYIYERKQFNSITKPCNYAQALRAFNSEMNSFGSFTLVAINVASAQQIAEM